MRFFSDMTRTGQILLAGSVFLHTGLIALSLAGMLPPGTGDFFFFFFLATLAALYRPGWMFLLLVATFPLETINLAPTVFGIDLRPYQFLVAAISVGLLIRFLSKRTLPERPALGRADLFLSLVVLGAFPAALNAPDPGASLRLSIILLSFYALYLLARTYLRSIDDVRRILPFVFASGIIVLVFTILQGARSVAGLEAFEVMPGRPNAMFPEPDWLGAYLVLLGTGFLALGASFRADPDRAVGRFRMTEHIGLLAALTLTFSALLMTVSRSAWLGMLVSGASAMMLFAYARRDTRAIGLFVGGISAAFLLAVSLVLLVPLTRFDLSGRAASTGGFQEITVSCDAGSARSADLPERVTDVSELAAYDCRHIDLEEIAVERAAGNVVTTTERPDPNVDIRKDIYAKSWTEVRKHPILGIGWGSISSVLGTDARGTGLNASNVFLEIWLGSGIIGLMGFLGFIMLVLVRTVRALLRPHPEDGPLGRALPLFVLSAMPGLLVFDCFNSGILLGFLWIFFAAALAVGRTDNSSTSENRN